MSTVAKLCCLLIAIGVTGCGEPSVGNAIRGTVTLGGQPLDQGTIEFSPAAGQGTMSGGPIKDGQYLIPPEHGLEPGAYTVRIASREGGQPPTDELPGETLTTPKQRIPPEYNSETTLVREVKGSGENQFDFAIP